MKNNNIVIMYDIMKNVNRIYFKAQSLENSEMKWNYSGNGNITVINDCEKVYNCYVPISTIIPFHF